jgi:hypothetical protein
MTGGITLVLEQDVLVNAPFDEPYCAESRLALVGSEGQFELRLDGLVVPVLDILPLPGYLDEVDDEGRAVADVAMSHGDRIRLSPIEGCAFDCSFCDMGGRYVRRSPEQIMPLSKSLSMTSGCQPATSSSAVDPHVAASSRRREGGTPEPATRTRHRSRARAGVRGFRR